MSDPTSATDAGCVVETFTTSDGYPCHVRRYAPTAAAATPRRGLVVYLHGIQSHGGWYGASCRHLAAEGWEVLFLDRRGSGLNAQARGDAPSYARLVADVAELIEAQSERPFLVAVSWGGKLAVALEQSRPGLVAGLALLTPGLCPKVRPALWQRLRIAWSRLVAPGRHFPIPLDDPELFTATPRWREYIRTDPLSLRTATARFLVSSVFLDRALRRGRGRGRTGSRVTVPVLLMLAGRDRIIDNAQTRNFISGVGNPAVTEVLEYADAHHTLEFEERPEPAFRDLAAWLDRAKAAVAVTVA